MLSADPGLPVVTLLLTAVSFFFFRHTGSQEASPYTRLYAPMPRYPKDPRAFGGACATANDVLIERPLRVESDRHTMDETVAKATTLKERKQGVKRL